MQVVELEVSCLEDVLSLSHDTLGSPAATVGWGCLESGLEAVLICLESGLESVLMIADVSTTWVSSRYEGTYQRDAT